MLGRVCPSKEIAKSGAGFFTFEWWEIVDLDPNVFNKQALQALGCAFIPS
jgi:hypothetical protein